MARIMWGLDGERFFEAGIDRGVLYPPGDAGVPWNGLKAVRETPNGGEALPYYIDGYKYANISAAEEFAATLEAFSSPYEFSLCDGSARVASGLYATQQPRKPFGLSYRTKVGNDINGVDNDYKIHLVYNALASATGRANASISDSVSPLALSWNITSRPPLSVGYKPTAHLVIHTRDVDPEILQAIENLLYGDEVSSAGLPTQADLIALMSA